MPIKNYTAEELAKLVRDHFSDEWSPQFLRSQADWILRHVFKKSDWLASNILDRSHDRTASPRRTWFFNDPGYPLDVWLVRYIPESGRYIFRRIV